MSKLTIKEIDFLIKSSEIEKGLSANYRALQSGGVFSAEGEPTLSRTHIKSHFRGGLRWKTAVAGAAAVVLPVSTAAALYLTK